VDFACPVRRRKKILKRKKSEPGGHKTLVAVFSCTISPVDVNPVFRPWTLQDQDLVDHSNHSAVDSTAAKGLVHTNL
jgi:hypothetical protein